MPGKTLEQINTQYDARLEVATDETRPTLELAKEREVGQYYRELAQERETSTLQSRLQAEFPDADPDAIGAGTETEMRARAEASQKRYQDRTEATRKAAEEAATAAAGQRAYGGPRTGQEAGSGTPATGNDSRNQFVEDHWEKLRTGVGHSRAESEHFQKTRVAQVLEKRIKAGVEQSGGRTAPEGDE